MQVMSLFVAPVKSMGGYELDSARLDPWGLRDDRRWAVLSDELELLTAREVRVGDVRLRFAEHCDRCVMTTYDPETLAKGPEPIRTLARHRSWDGKTWFGLRLIPDTTGRLRVGDAVEVLSTEG